MNQTFNKSGEIETIGVAEKSAPQFKIYNKMKINDIMYWLPLIIIFGIFFSYQIYTGGIEILIVYLL